MKSLQRPGSVNPGQRHSGATAGAVRSSAPARRGLAALALVSAAVAATPALAVEAAGDNTVRVGMYFVHYSASANDLAGPYTPPGINLRVESVNTPYAAYLRHLTGDWDMELAAGVPPTTHTFGVGPAKLGSVPFNGQEVATARWFSPTLFLVRNFRAPTEALRPYVGLGFNYTHFYERNATAAGDAVNGGPTSTGLTDSFGPAATAGLSYRFTPRISVNGSYSVARIRSQYSSNTAGIVRSTLVDFHPSSWVLAVGYSF
jgi:outer membrane protein